MAIGHQRQITAIRDPYSPLRQKIESMGEKPRESGTAKKEHDNCSHQTPHQARSSKMTIDINLIGKPPERHADRVVANILKHLAEQNAGLWQIINDIAFASSDGTPSA
jgi:hypothetical protein